VVDQPLLALAVTIAWVLAVAWRRPGLFAVRAVPMVVGVIVLGANVFPWYVVWLVPFLAVTPSMPLIAFTGSVGFAYSFFLSEPWVIPWWARLVEVAPLAIAAVAGLREAHAWIPTVRPGVG
jgi:hypothetical protein